MEKTVTKKESVDIGSDRPKPCKNRELYPDWPFLEWSLQTEEYFHSVRGLQNEGDEGHLPINDTDFIELFGHARQLRATNPKLDPEHLHALTKLYWQCYGTNNITNNEIQLWFMKGYVVGKKGKKLNWCAAVARILRLKVGRMLLAKAKSGEINMSKFSSFVGDGNPTVIGRGHSESHIIDRPITVDGVCPFRVSTIDLEAIDDVLTTYSEILQLCRGKIVTLEAARNSIREKLFALELNMDGRKIGILETEESISGYEKELTHLEDQIREFLDEVSFFFLPSLFSMEMCLCIARFRSPFTIQRYCSLHVTKEQIFFSTGHEGVDFSCAY
jgi:hypothetical protein